MLKYLILILLLCSFSFLKAQEKVDDEFERLLEKIYEETDDTPELEELEMLLKNPLDLITASVEEISKIPGITFSTATRIKKLIDNNENIKTNEIANTLKFTDEQRYFFKIFVSDSANEEAIRKSINVRYRSKQVLNKTKGFADSSFLGNSLNLYQRYLVDYSGYSAGLLLDKDAGERFITDFKSGFLSAKFDNINIIAGDYYIQCGMGNMLWKSFGMKKGVNAIAPVLQIGSGIMPYKSSLEFNYFRGVAANYNLAFGDDNKLKLIGWYSSAMRAGTTNDSDNRIISIYKSNYFRSTNEISKLNNLHEVNYGGLSEIKMKDFFVGLSVMNIDYDKPIYNNSILQFKTKNNVFFSLYSFYNLNENSIGFEISRDANKNTAAQAGFQRVTELFDFAVHYRRFTADYQSPYAYSFAAAGASDEEGIYAALNLKFIKDIIQVFYFDYSHGFGLGYLLPIPKKNIEVFSETRYSLNNKTTISGRIEYNTGRKSETVNDIKEALNRQKILARLDLYSEINSSLSVRLRTDAVFINYNRYINDKNGIAGFAEINWRAMDNLFFGCRLTCFATEGFDAAIWQYEPTLPGYSLSNLLYDDGSSGSFIMKWEPFEFVNLSARYYILFKNEQNKLGSSYNEIPTDTDKKLYLQVDFKL